MVLSLLFSVFAILLPALAQAQLTPGNWLDVNYTYTDLNYTEPNVMQEKARFAGVKGDVGVNLFGFGAVSAGGSYMDGNLNYDGATFSGTPVKTVTKDYIRDTRVMFHALFNPLTLSYGVAQRYWLNDMVISYRRRTRYDYNPVVLTLQQGGFYARVEHDIWGKGWNKSHMSDVGGGRHDVEFTLGKGTGLGVELGFLVPTPVFLSHIFFSYHKWSVKQSDVQNDGVNNLVEPDNNTTTLQFGIGFIL